MAFAELIGGFGLERGMILEWCIRSRKDFVLAGIWEWWFLVETSGLLQDFQGMYKLT